MGNAPTARRICLADTMGPRFADAAAFMADLVAAANAEWRRHGAGGVHLIAARFDDGVAQFETGPGQAPLTVARVREHLKTKKGDAA